MPIYTFSPEMTSNNAPSPYVASASSFVASNYAPWMAFGGVFSVSNDWLAMAVTGWVKIDFGEAVAITGVRIVCPAFGVTTAFKDFTVEGSADDSTWNTLATVTNETTWTLGVPKTYTFSANYRYYRFNCTANNGNASFVGISEVLFVVASGSSRLIHPMSQQVIG